MHFLKSYNIDHEADIGLIKRKTKALCKLAQISDKKHVSFSTAISETIRNVLQYVGQGRITYSISADKPQKLVAKIEDQGSGINNLEEILSGSYKSKTGLGLGLNGSQKLVDLFSISSNKTGTTVILGINLETEQDISPEKVVSWLQQLKTESTNHLDQVKESNKELAEAYSEIQKQQKSLIELNSQLEQQANALEEKSQEILDFTNLVAHDLKSPLNNVTMMLEMLNEKLEGTDSERLSEMTLEQCSRMRDFINQVLDFSKAGNEAVKIEEVNTKEFLEKLLKFIKVPDKAEITIQADIPNVFYTEAELQMVFQNLITNALKYNTSDIKRVRIYCESTDLQHTMFVQDNGIGLSEEDQTQLFKFGKILSEIAMDESSGVGLSIIKNIVEKHQGHIGVNSKVGEGSTFYFTIPRNLN